MVHLSQASLTDRQLRASDVEVNDDAAQSLLQAIIDSLGNTATADTVRNLLDRVLTELETDDSATDTNLTAAKDAIVAALQAVEADVVTEGNETQALIVTLDAALDDLVARVGDIGTTDTVRELLLRIYGAVDGLELSVDNIDLQTDTLEAKQQATVDAIDASEAARLADAASLQSTLDSIDNLQDGLNEPLYRTLGFKVPDGSELRVDLGVTDQYFGYATDGTSTASAVWTVVRVYLTAGSPSRMRSRTSVAWDSRTSGW